MRLFIVVVLLVVRSTRTIEYEYVSGRVKQSLLSYYWYCRYCSQLLASYVASNRMFLLAFDASYSNASAPSKIYERKTTPKELLRDLPNSPEP